MKKVVSLILSLFCVLLIGCEDELAISSEESKNEISKIDYDIKEPYFDKNSRTLYLNNATITIHGMEILPIGDEENLEKSPILMITYEIKNMSDKEMTQHWEWDEHIDIYQDYNPQKAVELPEAKVAHNLRGEGGILRPWNGSFYCDSRILNSDAGTITIIFLSEEKKEVLGDLTINSSEIGGRLEEEESSSEQSSSSSPENPSSSSENSQVSTATQGEENALRSAKEYLSIMPFSYGGLVEQLEFEGYSRQEAEYGVDNCGADWKKEALESALEYLDVSAFSYSGLIEQLEFEQFTKDQATYGADNCGADWKEQAAKSAESYLDTMDFSRQELIEQLEYEGFSYEEAVYGVEANGY